jgi:putative membrane protein
MKKILHYFLLPFQKIWRMLCEFVSYGIKPVFMIFGHDLKTIVKSVSVSIVMIGLCLLPSLYAWINIYASWDPYSNTGNLPIAIVNKDEGTIFNGKSIRVGDSVIEQLKNNKSIGWDFVDEWQGNYGLNNGKYYALIEIPENFSARLTTLITANPLKPIITYSVNEKLNSIATKIADAAKNKLVTSIKTNFVKTVTDEAIKALETEQKNANFKTSQIKEVKTTFEQANSDIARLKGYLDQTNSDSRQFQYYLNQCTTSLPIINEKISSLQKIIDSNKSLIAITKQTVNTISNDLNSDLQMLDALDSQNQKLIDVLSQLNSNGLDKDKIGIMEQSSNLCKSLHISLKSDAEQIRNLNKIYHLSSLDLLADSLTYMDRVIVSEKSALDTQIPILRADTSKAAAASALKSLSGISSEVTKQVRQVSGSILTNGTPLLNNLADNLTIQLNNAGSIAELGRAMVPQLSALAVFGGATSGLSVNQANQLNDLLTTLQDNLNQLLSKMDGSTIENIDELLDLAQNHSAEISDFISSPIQVKEMQVYNTDIFGVGLTPFYTVLAIWVGALLACALLTVECEGKINGIKLNLKQRHFGKMLLFLSLSLIQSSIIMLGDVFVLGVNPANFWLMLGVGFLTSVTFTIIIFTLVSLFGNVGKAIAVIMMVFQIAGAGGIYPIQTNPRIFGILEPLWPFTYAINCFREAIAGPIWSDVQYNVRALLIFMGTFLLFAALKKPFHKLNTFMEHKFKEAKI